MLFVLLAVCLVDATYCTRPANNSWIVLAAIGLMLTLIFCSIIYFVGGLLSDARITAWGKVQIYQTVVAALIAVFIWGVITTACHSEATSIFLWTFDPPDTTTHPHTTLYNASDEFFETVGESAYMLTKLARYNMGVAYVRASISAFGSGAGLLGFLGGPSISWSVFPDEFAKISLFSNVLRVGTVSLLNTLFLKAVFAYISTGVLTLLLPAGLVLYSISFTRSIGSVLIALSIGLFILYPAVFAMLNIYWGPVVRAYTVPDTPELSTLSWIEEVNSWWDVQQVMTSAEGINWCKHPEYIYPDGTESKCDGVGKLSELLGSTWKGENNCETRIYDYIMYGGVLILSTIFFPYMGIIIIGALIGEISKVMGQELDVTKLATMI